MRRKRHYPPGVSVYHITSKCVDDQFLWRPSQRTTFVFVSTLAATIEKYKIGVYAVVVMANHFHLLVRANRKELSAAMQFFKSRLALTLNSDLQREGAMSKGRFNHAPILDDASFLQLMHYVHANPVRAHSVERAQEWPGLSSYSAITEGRGKVAATWFDEAAWKLAGRPKCIAKFTHTATAPIEIPPQWNELPPGELRAGRRALISTMQATERAAAVERRTSQRRVPTAARLAKLDPRSRPSEPRPKSPQPWAFGTPEAVRALREGYKLMLSFYQVASLAFRKFGILGEFPAGTFPPWIGKLAA